MTNDHLQFLPAALEIQETPPLPVGRYILWSIMVFFSIAVIWSWIGEVDIVSVATGKIVPSGRVKIIQPLETGVVRKIYVKEGDHVSEGDVLVELDSTLTGADRTQAKEQQLSLKVDRSRLLSILNTLKNDQRQVTSDKEQMTNDISSATPEQLRVMQQRIKSQYNEYTANRDALKDEKRQRVAEKGAISQRIKQLNATIPLISERAQSLADLLKMNMTPRVQWLEIEQERVELVNEREVQKNNLEMVSASIANITQRQAAQKAEFENQLLTELADVENRIAAFDQELIKAEQRVGLQKLVSPVTGKIHRLTIHTIGGVVTPAQELMHVVPEEGAIEIEAWVPNKDIGFVHEGQNAEIKVETFPFTKYGLIEGELTSLSNDATPDENLGLVYAMRVKMHKTTMQIKEKIVNLSPGMAVTVEMNLGKRRLIEFLLSPLLRYKDESMKER